MPDSLRASGLYSCAVELYSQKHYSAAQRMFAELTRLVTLRRAADHSIEICAKLCNVYRNCRNLAIEDALKEAQETEKRLFAASRPVEPFCGMRCVLTRMLAQWRMLTLACLAVAPTAAPTPYAAATAGAPLPEAPLAPRALTVACRGSLFDGDLARLQDHIASLERVQDVQRANVDEHESKDFGAVLLWQAQIQSGGNAMMAFIQFHRFIDWALTHLLMARWERPEAAKECNEMQKKLKGLRIYDKYAALVEGGYTYISEIDKESKECKIRARDVLDVHGHHVWRRVTWWHRAPEFVQQYVNAGLELSYSGSESGVLAATKTEEPQLDKAFLHRFAVEMLSGDEKETQREAGAQMANWRCKGALRRMALHECVETEEEIETWWQTTKDKQFQGPEGKHPCPAHRSHPTTIDSNHRRVGRHAIRLSTGL